MLLNSIELNKKFMLAALNQAKRAAQIKEVPIGAVIVRRKKIVAEAFNKKERILSSLAHAEIIAIKRACKKIQNWRLIDCEMFVTLRPCLMCAGAIVESRIKKVFYAADRNENSFEKDVLYQLFLRNNIELQSGLFASESTALLSRFFKDLRKSKS